MAVIDSSDGALRLARAILADLELYHEAQIRAGTLPREAVDEGRTLYRSRVAPRLAPAFEVTLAQSRLAALAEPVSAENLAAFEQVPAAASKARPSIGFVAATGVLAFVAVLAVVVYAVWRFAGGEVVARVPIRAVGEAGEAGLALPAGARLSFAVAASKSSSAGPNDLLLDIQARKAGDTVASTSCRGFHFKRAGTAWGNLSYGDCELGIPASGSDALHIATRWANPSVASSFEGLEIRVQRK